jgi:hypothetical protein
MPYLNCPRCALSIRIQATDLAMEHCPRCLGRARMPVPLYETPKPARVDLFRRTATSADAPASGK